MRLPKWMVRTAFFLLLGLSIGMPGLARAGPPFVTDDPEPVDYQHYEFYTFTSGTAVSGDTAGVGPAWEFNYGLIPNGQFHVIAPMAFDSPTGGPAQFGYGDTELGFKYRFIQEDKSGPTPMVGVFPLLELPTGDQGAGLGAGHVRAFFPVWVQKDLGNDWLTYGGGGYWINHGGGTLDQDYWFFGWLLQKQVTRQLALGGELFHQTAQTIGGKQTTGFNIGGVYDIDDRNHLLFSAGRALQNASSTNLLSWYLGYQITGP
jgi:hypothetical protein